MMLVQVDIHVQKNEVGSLPYKLSKNKLKVDQRPIFNSKNYKTLRRKQRCKSLWLYIRKWFFRFDTKTTVKKKIDKVKFINIKLFFVLQKTLSRNWKDNPQTQKIFADHISYKAFVSRTYNNSTVKDNNPISKWEKNLYRQRKCATG